jgi:hypothetical protein
VPEKKPAEDWAMAKAREWTEEMFTAGGTGTKADRLELVLDGSPKRALCGWGRGPFADRVADLLREVREDACSDGSMERIGAEGKDR